MPESIIKGHDRSKLRKIDLQTNLDIVTPFGIRKFVRLVLSRYGNSKLSLLSRFVTKMSVTISRFVYIKFLIDYFGKNSTYIYQNDQIIQLFPRTCPEKQLK